MSRKQRLALSATKPVPPYEVDPALTFYCPQENVTAFDEPRIRAFMAHLRTDYQPPASVMAAEKAALLLLPCTKTRPYLLDDLGFVPIAEALPEGFPVSALHNGLLQRGSLIVDRMVVSEPMGIVPFEYIYHWRGELSLVSRYDDPGLFEHRGTSVCTWRKDNTAKPLGNGKYRWGVNERAAALRRLKPYYHTTLGYVAPKMTSAAEKAADGLPRARKTGQSSRSLIGVNHLVPVWFPDSCTLCPMLPNRPKRSLLWGNACPTFPRWAAACISPPEGELPPRSSCLKYWRF